MTEQKQIKGFVIVPPSDAQSPAPGTANDAAWKLGYWTFAPTAGEAWFRKIGYEVHDIERPRMIQAWHDKGHRLREATLTIHPGEDETTDDNVGRKLKGVSASSLVAKADRS